MILIADSGATKTDWYAGDNPENGQLIETKGINPFHLKEEEVFRIIREQLVAQLANADTCTAVYFYGAGCIPEKTGIIRRSLEHFFPRADIHITENYRRPACADETAGDSGRTGNRSQFLPGTRADNHGQYFSAGLYIR